MFIFKVTEPSPLQDSSVRHKGGLPGHGASLSQRRAGVTEEKEEERVAPSTVTGRRQLDGARVCR